MRGKYSFCSVLLASSALLFWGYNAFAQPAWFPIPLGGIPVGVSPSETTETPVAPPPPSMMPPAPPPAGDTSTATTGTSEYGSTVSGGTTLLTVGTETGKGPGMSQLGPPLLSPPYARPETQTDEILRRLYPEGSVKVQASAAATADKGAVRSGPPPPFGPGVSKKGPSGLESSPVGQ
jgi:hypothetical protein